MRGTEEKGIDVRMAIDMISLDGSIITTLLVQDGFEYQDLSGP